MQHTGQYGSSVACLFGWSKYSFIHLVLCWWLLSLTQELLSIWNRCCLPVWWSLALTDRLSFPSCDTSKRVFDLLTMYASCQLVCFPLSREHIPSKHTFLVVFYTLQEINPAFPLNLSRQVPLPKMLLIAAGKEGQKQILNSYKHNILPGQADFRHSLMMLVLHACNVQLDDLIFQTW